MRGWGVLAVCALVELSAQEPPLSEAELLEELAQEEEVVSTLEMFEWYRRAPLCLLQATVTELSRLPGISGGLARRIRALLQRFPHLSYAELGDSLALTPEQLWVLQQATTLECSPPPGRWGRVRSVTTVPLVAVSGKESLLGSFLRTQGWAQAGWQWLRLGCSWDKDAGEPGVADFVSISLQAEPWQGVRCLFGDYRVSCATGLLLWGGGGFSGSGFSAGSMLRWKSEVEPWWSVREERFFRGVAVRWEWQWEELRGIWLGWFSKAPRSGRVDTLGVVRSVVTDGIFATYQDRSRRFSFREQAYGGAVELSWRKLRALVGILGLQYSRPLQTESRGQFLGERGALLSVALSYDFGSGEWVGEVLRDARGNRGGRSALRYRRGNFHAVLAVRFFPDSLRSPYGSGGVSGGVVSNEEGFFVGVLWRGSRQRVQLYGDVFRTPAAPYGKPVPTAGSEFGIRWSGRWGRSSELWLQLRYRTQWEAKSAKSWWQLSEEQLVSARAELSVPVLPSFRWRLRGEWRSRMLPDEAAFLLLTGAEAGAERWELRAWLGVYAIPSSALGIWVYERVATGVPRLHFLTGYGSYSTLWGRWELAPWMQLELSLGVLSRSSPLQLWGLPVQSPEVRTMTVAAELRL